MIELKEITKKKNKYFLEFDTETLEVFEEVIIEFMLLKNRLIDDSEYKKIKAYAKYIDTLHLAIDYVKKPKTIKEVKDYLYKLNIYDKNVINKLIDMGMLNDKMYASMYADYQARINLKGPKLIKKELELKGVEFDFEYPYYEENMKKLIDRFLKNNKDKPTKLLNYNLNIYLINKGYDKVDEYFYNDDEALIKKEIEKLKKTIKIIDNKAKIKLYNKLIQKGYDSSLIREYLDKL